MNEPQIMTALGGEKIIDIDGKPFVIPEEQISGKSELIKCEFYMLSDDLEFLVQNFLDEFGMYHVTEDELSKNKPLTFKCMEQMDEFGCDQMAQLYQRLYHYLKPFSQQEKD